MVHWRNLTTDLKSYQHIISYLQTQFTRNSQDLQVAFQTCANCQISLKKDFLEKFKSNIYLQIVPHYNASHFTNVLGVDHET